jgi:hypothetical protein
MLQQHTGFVNFEKSCTCETIMSAEIIVYTSSVWHSIQAFVGDKLIQIFTLYYATGITSITA